MNKSIISEVKSKPQIISPLSVAQKLDSVTGELKLRLCLDLSRSLNGKLASLSTRMDDLSLLFQMLDKDDYMITSDLKSMFLSLSLNDAVKTYFGFKFTFNNKERYFVFNRLCFGLATACAVMEILFKSVRTYLNKHKISFSLYIDDSIIKNKCSNLAKYQFRFYCFVIQCCGWQLSLSKTMQMPLQKIFYLGLHI